MKRFRIVLGVATLLLVGLISFQIGHTEAFDPFHRPTSGVKVSPVCTGSAASSVGCTKQVTTNPFSGNNGVLIRAALLLDWVIGITSVAVVLYSGFQYITSRGDPQRAVNARNTMLYALIGLLVAVLGQSIISFALNRLL